MIRIAIVLAIAACGHDVRLGTAIDAAVDAAPDGNGNPFTAGTYSLAFLDPQETMCTGTLTGMESAFAGITRASLGLTDGAVTFATPTGTTLNITGAPIASAFGTSTIAIIPNVNNPPGIWDGALGGDFSTGPAGTTRSGTDLGMDSTSSQPIMGAIAVVYPTSDAMGDCTVQFGAAFTQ